MEKEKVGAMRREEGAAGGQLQRRSLGRGRRNSYGEEKRRRVSSRAVRMVEDESMNEIIHKGNMVNTGKYIYLRLKCS